MRPTPAQHRALADAPFDNTASHAIATIRSCIDRRWLTRHTIGTGTSATYRFEITDAGRAALARGPRPTRR